MAVSFFAEEASDNQLLSILEQTMEYSWIPLGFRARLNEDQSVIISNIKKDEVMLLRCKYLVFLWFRSDWFLKKPGAPHCYDD